MQRIFSLAVALAVSLMLSACLVSDEPLLTHKNARALPIDPGSYDACQTGEEADGDCKVMQVSRNPQGLYKFEISDEAEEGSTLARFRAIGADAWAAQIWESGDESYHYFVAEKSGAGLSLSMIACEELPKALRDRLVASGDMEVDADATTCRAKSVKAVTASAKAYRAVEDKDRLVLTPAK